jgi:hypothetical protein
VEVFGTQVNITGNGIDLDVYPATDTITTPAGSFSGTAAQLQTALQTTVFTGNTVTIDDYRITGSTLNRWYTAPIINASLTTVNPGGPTVITAIPFIVSKAITIDQMAIEVTTLGTTSNSRVGIYTDDGNGYPATRLVDAGEIATTTTGVKTFTTGLPLTLSTAGLYWLAHANNGTGQNNRAVSSANLINVMGFLNSIGTANGGNGWQANFTYGALPTPFPTAGAAVLITAVTAIFVRLSA